tara:strand:+ start:95988 stop:96134 length:147 start_codon:yes stop_codon:yes gene_type:complete
MDESACAPGIALQQNSHPSTTPIDRPLIEYRKFMLHLFRFVASMLLLA